MPTVLITGASRGIGREFTRQYAGDGWRVLACCRTPEAASELRDLAAADGRISLHRLDVDDHASVDAAAAELRDQPVDLLLNNAGVIGSRTAGLGSMEYDTLERTLHTNLLGPLKVTEAFLGNLTAGGQKKIATISSRMGSLAETQSNALVYRTSKAAANMAMRCVALSLAGRGFVCLLLHPGWVRTDMGGPSAAVAVEDSVTGLRRTIAAAAPEDNGAFFNYDGTQIPW